MKWIRLAATQRCKQHGAHRANAFNLALLRFVRRHKRVIPKARLHQEADIDPECYKCVSEGEYSIIVILVAKDS